MNDMVTYGDKTELVGMATRFKTALRGGDKLNNNELIALAQVSKLTRLDPFIGELWYIPGKGLMIGIAGARRLWNEKSAAGGGWSSVDIQPCSPADAGYVGDIKDLAGAYKATAYDSSASLQYQKMFLETIAAMRAAGEADPFASAKDICGPRPQWVGYGYATVSETSKMNKTALARKRAEADALKKCINIPFGLTVSAEYEIAPDVTVDPEPEPEMIETTAEPVEMISPMSQETIKFAAKVWNISLSQAATALTKYPATMSKEDFKKKVRGTE